MALANYEIGEVFTGTGTATSSAASKNVVGTGSSFTTEFEAGDLITIASETRVVASVSDNTHLAVSSNFTTGSGGAVAYTGVDLTNVEDLTNGVPAPKSAFVDYSQYLPLGDGTVRGSGWATGEWRWGYLEQAERGDLRAYCTGASNSVYIRTRENDTSDQYGYYSCTVIWPQEEEKDHFYRPDFVLRFQKLVEVTVS